jgi:multidrug efflux pump subunit AcrA (membrane-fusion protein)
LREAAIVRLRYWLPLVLLGLLGFTAWKLIEWRNQPPEVAFTKAVRGAITSSVSTNGRVEPAEWAVARAEAAGPVERILVRLNQQVAAGAALVELDTEQAQAGLAAADTKIATARAELALFASGGRSADRASIQREIDATEVQMEQAQRDLETETALEAKQVSTKQAVTAKQDRVRQLTSQLAALNRQLESLVTPAERDAAQARLEEAQVARRQAELQIAQAVIRAPIAGTVYRFDLKPGAYLNPGDEVAAIGRLDRVRVSLFVDEPDLGRVAPGKPVTITWDAEPGRDWKGTVDRMPSRIEELGTRQVGEVICLIENPGGDLLPGTNVTAVILSDTVSDAVTIPKEALFRQDGHTGVYLLDGDHVTWRPVTQGVGNVTRVQVLELADGDQVALPSDVTLANGMLVRPPP